MKKTLLLFCMMTISLILSSQGNQYTQAMAKGMELLQKAQDKDQFLKAANHFERIAQAETEKWMPAYHASFAKAIASTQLSDPKDIESMLDDAQSALDNAASIEKNNSEINALQGFIYMLRIAVDPMTRGQQYSGMSAAALQKARALNPNNPRAVYLLTQLSYGTAQFFGSGSAEACQMNNQALEMFAAENSSKESQSFAPSWGKEMAESFRQQCVK